jgi:predicted DNA-binding transcriptional regulator AlpA
MKTPDDSESLWGPKECSAFLNIKVGTLFSHLSRGSDLPPFIKIGSQTRWRPSVVRSWVEAKEKEQKRRNFDE